MLRIDMLSVINRSVEKNIQLSLARHTVYASLIAEESRFSYFETGER